MKLTKIQFRLLFAIGMIFHFIALVLTYYYVKYNGVVSNLVGVE